MGADTSAQARLLGHACLSHQPSSRTTEAHPAAKAVSLFPQPAGGAKKTAHAQGTPKSAPARTYPHRHVRTVTPAYPPAKRRSKQSTFHRGDGGVPPFPQAAGGAKKTAHAQINPKSAPTRTYPHRHVRAVTPAYPTPPSGGTTEAHSTAKAGSPLSATGRRCKGNGAHPNQPQERTRSNIPTDTSARSRPDGRFRINGICAHIPIPPAKRQDNRITLYRQGGFPFPTTGRRAEGAAHFPGKPQLAYPLERIPTDTSAQARLHGRVRTDASV